MMKTTSRKTEPWRSSAVLNDLGARACNRIDELLYDLGVGLRREGRRYTGACPIHSGRKTQSFSLYPEGFEAKGYWKCRSDKCHETFTPSLVGFVRGVLSNSEHGWSRPGDPTASTREAAERIALFLGIALEDVVVDEAAASRRRLSRDVAILEGPAPATRQVLCSREKYRSMVEIPSPYYLTRGYRAETLERFEVGTVSDPRSPLYGRAFVPAFDEAHRDIIGGVTRSTHPRCEGCGLHHGDPPCPPPEADRRPWLRWSVVGRWNDKNTLYNSWRATASIRKTKSVVLVEGAGDVWRLDEAGVPNVVGLFGSEPSPIQIDQLMTMMPRQITILTDDDRAGHACAETIAKKCRFATVTRLLPVGAAEVGDMGVDAIKEYLVPTIEARMTR